MNTSIVQHALGQSLALHDYRLPDAQRPFSRFSLSSLCRLMRRSTFMLTSYHRKILRHILVDVLTIPQCLRKGSS